MNTPISIDRIQDAFLDLRDQKVLVDSDVARIYGVKTRDINKAVANNPGKFPQKYILSLTRKEKQQLVEKFHRFQNLKHSTVSPKAFTERGLYMLATILKSAEATAATIAIIEAYAKLRQLAANVHALSTATEPAHQKSLMAGSGQLFTDLLDEHLRPTDSETSLELNFAVLKFRHTVKRTGPAKPAP